MYSRAGLVGIVLALLIAFTVAAPIPTTNTTPPRASLSHRTPLSHSITSKPQAAFAINHPHAHNHVVPSASVADGVDERELVYLVRRKSIFTKIRDAFRKAGHAIKKGFQKVGHAIKKGFQKAGHAIKKGFQKAGHAIKKGFQKVGHAIKHVAQKIGHGIKVAAKKVGHFIKTTGAKIAKVGLKIISTVQKVASKVVSFIPGVGKVLSKVMDGASAATNAISNRIHVKIGGKLGKAMKGMDKARKIVGYIPRELPEDFEERDLGDFDFEEFDARDAYEWDSLMDARADYDEWLYERGWDDWEDPYMY
ncbi:hypothetical protein BDN70DRAFT_887872 [Pholiota conissans]|uniref:Uncharacterized protein n=1 Tax=Pholiota conissans TaxID=109636 RepID=A0A9P5YN37_9AGAR|nr:hypothetical protein BDN70DRAFT_887872 [Pholiota conissans]